MTSPLSISAADYCLALKALVELNSNALGVRDTYYGDQERIATTPTVCIDSESKDKNLELKGAGRFVTPNLTASVILYHAPVTSTEVGRLECDRFIEAVETLIDSNRTLSIVNDGNDLVIHSYISRIEFGYFRKNGTVFRGARGTASAISRGILPS